MLVELARWFFWLILYSFAGWVYESILCSITQHKLVNRGFLNGPLCPIYGCGALVVILCLGRGAGGSVLSLFLSGAVLCCTLEYLTSWLMEKLFHARWWDYSHYRFQLNGRICLAGAVAFGAMSVLILKVVHPWVADWTYRIPDAALLAICAVLLVLLAADTAVTVRAVLNLDQKLAEVQRSIDQLKEKLQADWKEDLQQRRGRLHDRGQRILEQLEAHGELWNSRLKELLSQHKLQERRMLRAFPKFQPTVNREALAAMKARLEEWRKEKKEKGRR